jgi:hypothetical protein
MFRLYLSILHTAKPTGLYNLHISSPTPLPPLLFVFLRDKNSCMLLGITPVSPAYPPANRQATLKFFSDVHQVSYIRILYCSFVVVKRTYIKTLSDIDHRKLRIAQGKVHCSKCYPKRPKLNASRTKTVS